MKTNHKDAYIYQNFVKMFVTRKILLLAFLFTIKGALAQEGRFTGMGNASVMLPDFWSVFANQAGISDLEEITVGANYYQAYQMWELGIQNFGVVLPTKTGNFAASYQRSGYPKFSTNSMGIGFARNLGEKWSASVQFDYLYYYQPEQTKKRGAFLMESGILTEPVEGLFIGAHVYNPTMVKLSDSPNEKVPTLFRIGLGYYFSEWVLVNFETEKELTYQPRYKFGLEYQIVTHFFARLGLITQPNQFTAGIGYQLNKLTVDVAFVTHETLPFSSQLSIKYHFK